ncbi:MAG TPA: helix-turn-helix domain-containing protein [Thermoanaerobaculia bacterium]|nr:helix-turn-helix domain-containing protein [Thermoanaerobaculia bacterium]
MSPRGRPRRAGADEEILAVALELLREKGYRDLNVDEVAERAGVAKTTVYRRWPTKGALVAGVVRASGAPPPEGAPEARTTPEILRETAALLQLIAGVDDVEVLRAVIAPQRARIRALVDSDLTADMLLGTLIVRVVL